MDSLIVGQETDFKALPVRTTMLRSVGGFIDDGNPSEDWSEVGVVGASEAAAVAEDNVESSFPALWNQVELGHNAWVGD